MTPFHTLSVYRIHSVTTLKKKKKPTQNPKRPFLKNTDLPSPLIAETGFRVFGARQIDPRKNESLNEMKDSLALNCH